MRLHIKQLQQSIQVLTTFEPIEGKLTYLFYSNDTVEELKEGLRNVKAFQG